MDDPVPPPPDDTARQVAELKKLLDAELDRKLSSQWGCWPLLVAAVGVLLGIALLFGVL